MQEFVAEEHWYRSQYRFGAASYKPNGAPKNSAKWERRGLISTGTRDDGLVSEGTLLAAGSTRVYAYTRTWHRRHVAR